jgi:hypothetical protein
MAFMKSFYIPSLLAACVGLGEASLSRAQEKLPAPVEPGVPVNATLPPPGGPTEYSSSCGWFRKCVHPTVENVTHKCVRYDCEEEDYAYTKCAHTPILGRFCDVHCWLCGHHADESCPKCGHPRTRKVLIKEFVPEEVPTPKCQVERVPAPAKPACGTPTVPKATCPSGD